MDSKAILRRLQQAGWFVVAQQGSHVQLKHPERKGRVTVPHPKRDLPLGTLRSIERQSGVSLR
ncbi:MAG: type II toxin-antitoxin system HicA family toxin [Myxococcales bacterium]|nr:type II toxin-antitoxin system HicA family toxin [Myxococcales bacterium]